MDLLNVMKNILPPSSDDERENDYEEENNFTKVTSRFYSYPNDPLFIFKHDGKNKGWLCDEESSKTFIIDFATDFEKKNKTPTTVITRESSDDGYSIKVFSKNTNTWWGEATPELIATFEIEKIVHFSDE